MLLTPKAIDDDEGEARGNCKAGKSRQLTTVSLLLAAESPSIGWRNRSHILYRDPMTVMAHDTARTAAQLDNLADRRASLGLQ